MPEPQADRSTPGRSLSICPAALHPPGQVSGLQRAPATFSYLQIWLENQSLHVATQPLGLPTATCRVFGKIPKGGLPTPPQAGTAPQAEWRWEPKPVVLLSTHSSHARGSTCHWFGAPVSQAESTSEGRPGLPGFSPSQSGAGSGLQQGEGAACPNQLKVFAPDHAALKA